MKSSSTADEENLYPDEEELIKGYKPFIADKSMFSQSAPFSVIKKDTRTDEEIERIRHSLRIIGNQKEFTPPLRLSDFCLIAKQKWEADIDDDDDQVLVRVCNVH